MKFIPDYIEISDHQQSIAQISADTSFALAMGAAIDAKQETVVPGIHRDARPLLTTMFRGYPAMSGCGSPAAMCAEAGEG
jgi:hypothetical protein